MIMQVCDYDSCEVVVHCKGLCKYHYNKRQRANYPSCTEVGCNTPWLSSVVRLCAKHYWRTPEGSNYKLRRYGITSEKYHELNQQQQQVCAICGLQNEISRHGTRKSLCVDHDHETGEVRGLLCTPCNVALGNLRDSVELLNKAIEYLNKRSK